MMPKVRKGGKEPFPGSSEANRALDAFCSDASEFCDSLAVVVVSSATPEEGQTHSTVRLRGNANAAHAALSAWHSGAVMDGSWYVGPQGTMSIGEVFPDSPDAGFPLPWADSIRDELYKATAVLEYRLDGAQAGVLVVATCGEGPGGTTKVFSRAFGNSMACLGAVDTWLSREEEYG